MLKPLLAVLFLTLPALAQTPYRDQALGYSLTIPTGWAAKDQAEIDMLNDEMHRRMPNRNFRYTAGFSPNPDSESSPYILVQFTRIPFEGASYDDLEKALGATSWKRKGEHTIKEAIPDFVKSANLGKATLDRDTNRVFLDLSMTGTDGGTLRGRSVMHLVQDGAIQINFYSPSDTFEKNLPLLEPFLASFQLDPGRAFVPRTGFNWNSVGGKAAIGAGIGLLIGLVHWLKKKPAKQVV